ncbi:MAG: hypothetical protein K1X29_09090 [Bdellovibrionales bacterium]|nr:hypothetical protein [Bdellovibrionales bacterium]
MGFSTTVPEGKIGPWVIKNVSVSYCDHCQPLAGKSFLKHFNMNITHSGELGLLELKKSL